MKILITTGGTGGHIYPALALADYIKGNYDDVDFMFVGNADRMEKDIIPEQGYRFVGIEAAKFNEASHKLSSLKTLYRAYEYCLKLVEDYKPDVVVGFGSYVTVPVMMAAVKMKIPTVIHEQNSFAGMANKSLGHFVDKIVTVYENVNKSFPAKKTVCLGNPRESSVLTLVRDKELLRDYGLNPDKKTLLIVMGSLGSQTVNERMLEILNALRGKDYNVLYVTGKNNYNDFVKNFDSVDNIVVKPYIDQFNVAAVSDLVVSRGGATSACEYMALGTPTIIVPSPYVTNNHQYYNARSMEEKGACRIIQESDLSVNTLVPQIDELMNDELLLQTMSRNALNMSHPYAARDISDLIMNLVERKK